MKSTLLFKARTDSRERQRSGGGENDKCEKCGRPGERHIETLEHIECEAYEEERKRFQGDIIKTGGKRMRKNKNK